MTEKKYVTYLAPLVKPDGTESPDQIELGRGDLSNPDSNAHRAFASVPTPEGEQHETIAGHLDRAAAVEPITRDNGAQALAKAAQLATRGQSAH